MGASVIVYWPGLTDEQMESMPGFFNDDRAWGNWMAERDGNVRVLEAVNRSMECKGLQINVRSNGHQNANTIAAIAGRVS